jgi:hypothetical protein
LYQRLVKEADSSRAIVSLDWVSDCLALDQLLDVDTYRLQASPLSNKDFKWSARQKFQYHRSDLISIELEELSKSVAASLSAQATSSSFDDLQHGGVSSSESHSYKERVSTIVFEVPDECTSPPKSTEVDIASESMRDHNQHETPSPTQTSSDNDHIDLEIGIAAECMYPDGYLDWLRDKYIGWNGSDPASDLGAEMAQWVRLILCQHT